MEIIFNWFMQHGSPEGVFLLVLIAAQTFYIIIIKNRLIEERKHIKELATKYALHDRHILLLSFELERLTGRQLVQQAERGEWRTRHPLADPVRHQQTVAEAPDAANMAAQDMELMYCTNHGGYGSGAVCPDCNNQKV